MESTSTVPDVPLTEAISTSLNDHVVEACVKEVDKDVEKIPTAAPAPPATAEKAVSKDVEEIPVAAPALPATAEEAVNKDVEEIPVSAPCPATGEKAVNKDLEKIPEAAPAPPTSAEKEVTKKTYASIVSFYFHLLFTCKYLIYFSYYIDYFQSSGELLSILSWHIYAYCLLLVTCRLKP